MKKITKKKLQELHACAPGIAWFESQEETNPLKIIKGFISSSEHLDWANWLIARLMDGEQKRRYAIFAAESVLHIFESRYPDDERPRKAIEAAKKNNAAAAAYAAAAAAADAVAAADSDAAAAADARAVAAATDARAVAAATDARAVAAATDAALKNALLHGMSIVEGGRDD